MICDHEEAMNITIPGYYYRPIQYLSKHLFSEAVLLDVFCTGYFIASSEDNYYDDLDMNMIAKYQPHIDTDRFLHLWQDLKQVLQLELVAEYLHGGHYLNTIVSYRFSVIHQTMGIQNTGVNKALSFFNKLLSENKYSIKMGWNKKIVESIGDAVVLSHQILASSPEKYSTILPL